jgi:hypothetical protein
MNVLSSSADMSVGFGSVSFGGLRPWIWVSLVQISWGCEMIAARFRA